MAKVETLRTGRWASELATAQEVSDKVKELRAICSQHGWGDRSIHPYGWAVKIDEFLGWHKDYQRCTHSSKQMALSELNGFIKIINAWLEQEEEPKVVIKLIAGKHAGEVRIVPASQALDYYEMGWAEAYTAEEETI